MECQVKLNLNVYNPLRKNVGSLCPHTPKPPGAALLPPRSTIAPRSVLVVFSAGHILAFGCRGTSPTGMVPYRGSKRFFLSLRKLEMFNEANDCVLIY